MTAPSTQPNRAQRGVRYDIGAPPPPVPRSPLVTSPDPAPTRSAVQVAVLATCVVALLTVGLAVDEVPRAIGCALVLGLGVIVALLYDLSRLFKRVSGIVVALAVFCVLFLGAAMLRIDDRDTLIGIFPMVAIFFVGLDWRRTDRLRALVWVTGILVVPSLGAGEPWAWLAATVWLALAMGSLWLLEQDRLAARPRPDSPGGGATEEPPLRTADVVRAALIALGVGLAVAMLLGNPSCNRKDSGASSSSFDESMSNGVPPPHYANGGEVPDQHELQGGNERTTKVDSDGSRYLEDPQTGERYSVEEGTGGPDGEQIVRDGSGREVGRIGPDGFTATDGDGTSQTYKQDESGRAYVEGPGGERFYLGTEDGRSVLRDADGTVVASGTGENPDHLYIRDPNGSVLVPDPDGDGEVPGPVPALREGVTGSGDGYRISRQGGRTIVTDEDGSYRVYEIDQYGLQRVTVVERGKPTRTYVSDPDVPNGPVSEYDEYGNLVRRYTVDDKGVLISPQSRAGGSGGYGSSGSYDGSSSSGSSSGSGSGSGASGSSSGGDGGTTPTTTVPDSKDDSSTNWWLIAGLVVLVAAAIAVVVVLLTRRNDDAPEVAVTGPPPSPWALDCMARIEAAGAAAGRRRISGETVLGYTAALSEHAVPDARLPAVGEVLSAALFGRGEPPPEVKAWVESVLHTMAAAPAGV